MNTALKSQPLDDRLSPRNFDRLAKYIYDYSGIKMPSSKRTMLEGRLRRRLRHTGHATFDAYCDYLFRDDGLEAESIHLIDAVTTNKTDFFREADHFIQLTETLIPARLSKRKASGAASMFKVWSAAASTGAEAYTAAMVLADRASRRGEFEWGILGTDINTQVLSDARRAVYSGAVIAPVPLPFRDRFLMRGQGAQSGQWRIAPALRRRVRFQQLNLMDKTYPVDRDLDVIFLRNVLIYFDAADQAQVIARLAGHLAPQGHLIVGHSESMVVRHPMLTQVAPAVYRKD